MEKILMSFCNLFSCRSMYFVMTWGDKDLLFIFFFFILWISGTTYIPGQNFQPICGHYTISNFCFGIWRGNFYCLALTSILILKSYTWCSCYSLVSGYSSSHMHQIWTCRRCKPCLACSCSDGYMLPNCLPYRKGNYYSLWAIASKI